MSALALLTGRLAAGVWRAESMPRLELTALAEGLGWSVRAGQINAPDDKATYLSQLGAIAGVPEYVRPNWDSLADGLRDTDITTRWLLIIETDEHSSFDAIAIEVLNEAVDFWSQQGATMQVAWRGPVDAPDLAHIDPVRRSRG